MTSIRPIDRLRQLGLFLLSGELFLFLVPVSGQFKDVLPLQGRGPIDYTVIFMVLSFFCAAWRVLKPVFDRRGSFGARLKGGLVEGFSEIPWKRLPWLLVPYLLVVFSMIVSTRWSLSDAYAKEKIRDFGVMVGWCIIGSVFILNNKKSMTRFLACNAAYGVIMTVGLYIVWIAESVFRYKYQVEVFNTNYLQVSRYALNGMIILLCYALLKASRKQNYVLIPLVALMFGAVMIAGARSNVVLAFAAIGFFGLFMFYAKGGLARSRRWYLAFLPLLVFLLYMAKMYIEKQGFYFKENWLNYATVFAVCLFAAAICFLWPRDRYLLRPYWRRYIAALLGCMVLFSLIGYTGRLRYISGRFDNFSTEVEAAAEQHKLEEDITADAAIRPPAEAEKEADEDGTGAERAILYEDHQRLRVLVPWTGQADYREQLVKERKLLISRFNMYLIAWDMFKQRPVTGWGVGSFPVYTANLDKRLFPHFMPLEIMAEEGLLGVVPFMALLFAAFFKGLSQLWKNRKTRLKGYYLCVFSVLCFWLTMVISSDTSQGVRIMYMFITIAILDPASFRAEPYTAPDAGDFEEIPAMMADELTEEKN